MEFSEKRTMSTTHLITAGLVMPNGVAHVSHQTQPHAGSEHMHPRRYAKIRLTAVIPPSLDRNIYCKLHVYFTTPSKLKGTYAHMHVLLYMKETRIPMHMLMFVLIRKGTSNYIQIDYCVYGHPLTYEGATVT